MKVGAEPRKVALLLGLLAVLAYVAYTNFLAGEPSTPRTKPGDVRPRPVAQRQEAASPRPSPRPVLGEFRASLRRDQREGRLDPAAIDPTLRLDLLARVRAVTPARASRNLFQFGPAPLPKTPEPKIIPEAKPSAGPPPGSKPEEAPKPPPPPIPLKFYGYASQGRSGEKRAFFLDGEDIIVATEGELIKKRYKILRIGVNSALVEDVEHKHQQTLAMEAIS